MVTYFACFSLKTTIGNKVLLISANFYVDNFSDFISHASIKL